MVVTCDHGRGSTLGAWSNHGDDVPGAEQIWIVVVGPDTPALGEAANVPEVFQRDIAPTILELLGVDYREYRGVEGRPMRWAIAAHQARVVRASSRWKGPELSGSASYCW